MIGAGRDGSGPGAHAWAAPPPGSGGAVWHGVAARATPILAWRGLPATLLGIFAFIIVAVLQPSFMSASQLTPFFANYVPTALLAVGVAFSMLIGGIDLSVGPVMGLCSILTVLLSSVGFKLFTLGPNGSAALCADPKICEQGISLAPMAIIVVVAGGLIGAINGAVVAYFRLQPLVVTLATGFIVAGFSLWIFPQPGGQIPSGISTTYGANRIFSWPVIAVIGATLIAYLFMRTSLGVRIRSVGSNRSKAFASGVQVPSTTLAAYTASGVMAGLAGVLYTFNSASADPSVGITYTLTAIAGAVMGGTALRGGWAEPFGPAIGVLTIGLLSQVVTAAKVPGTYSELVTGAIILIGLTITQLAVRRWNESP